MPETVANQKVIHINRQKCDKNFVQISKENWYSAYRNLNATAFCLYLYLAGNRDGFDLAFSPKAVHEEMGMPISTCKDQVKLLIAKGYLVPKREGSNVFDFFEIPKEKLKAETASVF